jgi:hypothetical protein
MVGITNGSKKGIVGAEFAVGGVNHALPLTNNADGVIEGEGGVVDRFPCPHDVGRDLEGGKWVGGIGEMGVCGSDYALVVGRATCGVTRMAKLINGILKIENASSSSATEGVMVR